MSLFQTLKNALERNDADSAFEALQKASDGKLDTIFANNQKMRFYKPGEVDHFYDDLFQGVVQSAVYMMADGTFDQFEKGLRYQRLVNNYSTLNLRIDDVIVLVVH
ncbi:hypothetical protein pEaSNUABM29_00259 [Erwinia phage pEa_SNUABM_29]|nr:hypothetical protein pEaSNUABM29_00259 [Erwinia phage pEa_SNUABM_29]